VKVETQFRIASKCVKRTEIGTAHSEFVPTAFEAQSFPVLHSEPCSYFFFLGAVPPHHSSTFMVTLSSRKLLCCIFPVRARNHRANYYVAFFPFEPAMTRLEFEKYVGLSIISTTPIWSYVLFSFCHGWQTYHF